MYVDDLLVGRLRDKESTMLKVLERVLADCVSVEVSFDYSGLQVSKETLPASHIAKVVKNADNENLAAHMLFVRS
jgi:hypothetical protein